MGLAKADKSPIAALKRSDVETTTAALKTFVVNDTWLDPGNRYAVDIIQRLKSDAPLTPVHKTHLAHYIAASVTLHASDGWGYLGRAISCLLAGDPHRALHLAYYAELRAALSLLAGTGVAVFNKDHYILSGANTVSPLKSKEGTHVIAWSALEFWSQQPSSRDLFVRLIRPEGRALDDWFQPHGGSSALAAQASDWFLQWGMDLAFATKDRDARNESSYRPDGIPSSWSLPPIGALEFVQELWGSLEPSTPSSFEEIDRHVLRLALERHFFSVTGNQPSPQSAAFKKLIDDTLAAQAVSPAAVDRWRKFLLRQTAPDDPAVLVRSSQVPSGQPADVYAIASRAVLLLRLATGSANDILQQAGLTAANLEFWWRSVGEARGLWEPGSPPATLADLWADVQDSLDQIHLLATGQPAAIQSLSVIAANLGDRFSVLCSHERVALWALCPT